MPLRVGIFDKDKGIALTVFQGLKHATSLIVAPFVTWVIGVDEKYARL